MLEKAGKGAIHTVVSMDDDGGGSEANWDNDLDNNLLAGNKQEGDLLRGIPIGIREFIKTEKRLRERHTKERTAGR